MSTYPEWLSEDARKIFSATLPKLKDVTPEKLEMLAAYADAMAHLRKLQNDPQKARVWRGALIYCRNGLGLGAQVFIDLMDLLLDSGDADEISVTLHLDTKWQIERPEGYRVAEPNY